MHAPGFDGLPLSVTIMGEGPAILLLHGLFSSAETNWVRYGTARRLADAGWRCIMPDLRGHGGSPAPADPARWPPDVLALDAEAVLAHLGLGPDVVIAGYSLGARTVVRMLARGMRPRAAILAGMGLTGITDGGGRGAWFIRMIQGRGQWPRGSGEFVAERFMAASVPDPDALIPLLAGQVFTPATALAAIPSPTLVVAGAEDQDNGSAMDLAAALPNARHATIPGNHMSTVTQPELADTMRAFLGNLGEAAVIETTA